MESLTFQQLIETHNMVLKQLKDREESTEKLQTAASKLLSKSRPLNNREETDGTGGQAGVDIAEALAIQEQLAALNALWNRVQMKARARTEKLKQARQQVSITRPPTDNQ